MIQTFTSLSLLQKLLIGLFVLFGLIAAILFVAAQFDVGPRPGDVIIAETESGSIYGVLENPATATAWIGVLGSCLASLTSLVTFGSSLMLEWRKEAREAQRIQREQEKKAREHELELERMRIELERLRRQLDKELPPNPSLDKE